MERGTGVEGLVLKSKLGKYCERAVKGREKEGRKLRQGPVTVLRGTEAKAQRCPGDMREPPWGGERRWSSPIAPRRRRCGLLLAATPIEPLIFALHWLHWWIETRHKR